MTIDIDAGYLPIPRIRFSPEASIEVRDPDGKLVVRAHYDGTVEFGEGITPDEAAREFWECMGKYAPSPVQILPGGVNGLHTGTLSIGKV
jgi:hypothetical protein